MITNENIGNILAAVKKEVKQHELPIVTFHAQLTKDPFRVLIATMLSLRTKDQVTAVAAKRLFAKATTPKQMRKIPLSELEKMIYPVGFYPTKAKQIHAVCDKLLAEFNGKVPADIEVLTTFPGVGRKTANLVMTLGFGKPAMCVDTHVHRISNIWGYVQTKTPDQTEIALRAKLPKKYWMEYNDLLVSFGQHLCVPVSPKCSQCPLAKVCPRIGVTQSR